MEEEGEVVGSVGADVGELKGTERNRIDSILAEGTKDRMCLCNCFCSGYLTRKSNQ